MKTKTIFLWLLLALLVGGVNGAWASSYVLNFPNRQTNDSGSATFRTNSQTITVTNGKEKAYDQYSSTEYVKFSNVTHTISGIPTNERITNVSFSGTIDGSQGTTYISNINGTSYTEDEISNQFVARGTVKTCSFDVSITGGSFTFETFKTADLTITITTEAITYTNTVTLTSPLGSNLTAGELTIVGTQKIFTVNVGATHNATNATCSYSGDRFNVSISSGVLAISAKADATFGSETITVNVPAEGSYAAGSTTLTATYWTGDISPEYYSTDKTWTFNTNWTNSGLFYNHESECGWVKDGNHFEYNRGTLATAETAQVCETYVEQMFGLKVAQTENRKVWMQSTNDGTNYLGILAGGTITIPGVEPNSIVEVNVYSSYTPTMTIARGENSQNYSVTSDAQTFRYTVPSYGDVVISTSGGTGNSALYFNSIAVKQPKQLTRFEFNSDEVVYNGNYINSTIFNYSGSASNLKVKAYLSPAYASIDGGSPSFTVTSSNTNVITTGSVTASATTNGVYFDNLSVVGAGTTTLTFTYNAGEYVTKSFTQDFTVYPQGFGTAVFDYVAANGKLLKSIGKPVKGTEVTYINNGVVRLTASCGGTGDDYPTVEFQNNDSKTDVKWQNGAFLTLSSDLAAITKVMFVLNDNKSEVNNISFVSGGGSGTANNTEGTYTWTNASGNSFVQFTTTGNVNKVASIYVEYLERTPVDRWSPKGGNANTTTFDYAAGNPEVVYHPDLIIAPSSLLNTTDYEVAFTSNRNVIDISEPITITNNNSNEVIFGNLKRGVPGSANVYYRFKGTSTYAGAMVAITYTINKAPQPLTFTNATVNQNYSASGTYTQTVTQSSAPSGNAITYSSSDTNVATVNSSTGVVSFVNSGTVTITASVAGNDYYEAGSASYTLTITGNSGTIVDNLEWDWTNFSPQTSLAYGSSANVRATTTDTHIKSDNTTAPVVQYRSSNTNIATVTTENAIISSNTVPVCKITPVGNGSVTITAYVAGVGDYNPKEVTYTLNIIGDKLKGLQFHESSANVMVGYTVSPYMHVPNAKMSDITAIKVKTASTTVATVAGGDPSANPTYVEEYELTEANGGLKSNGGDLAAIYPTIKGITEGQTTVTVTITSEKYKTTTTTCTINVVPYSSTPNFAWVAPTQEYTIYTDDYMKIPAYTGNANGNWHFSKGETCKSQKAYLYAIKKGTPEWNYADYKLGHGIPDFKITESDGTTATDKAYVMWVNGNNTHDDILMIYARKVGDVKLHAIDPQTNGEISTITIHVKDKGELAAKMSEYVDNMNFPYTWDFTTNFSMANMSPNYWEAKGDYYTCGASTMFNWDYADGNNNGSVSEAVGNKYFVGYSSTSSKIDIMPQFYGMTIFSGNSGDTNTKSWEAKEDKLRILNYNSSTPDAARLFVNGGTHFIKLPQPGGNEPDNYKLIVMAQPTGDKCTIYKYKDGNHGAYAEGNEFEEITSKKAVVFDMTKGDDIELGVGNVKIYWIAMTTEVKAVNIHPTSSKAAATYSYAEDLDFDKSFEANNSITSGSNLKAYYASGYSSNSVTMTQVPVGGTKEYQGVLLKSEKTSNGDYYMVANPRNVETYSELSTLGTNYLVGTTDKAGSRIPSSEEIDGTQWSNFVLSTAYDEHDAETDEVVYSDVATSDWAFYRIHNTGTPVAPANMAYLHIPTESYHVTPSSSRALGRKDSQNDNMVSDLLYLNFVDRDGTMETVAIETATMDGEKSQNINNDVWYTLQGVPVKTPTKGGIYILNGKKILVK